MQSIQTMTEVFGIALFSSL